MKPKLHIYTLIAILLCALLPSRLSAQPATGEASAHDSLRISLLTCVAGEEIYTLFGHTAIRSENLTRKTDVVYNYGVFDFSSGGFVLRFALGETDYRLDKSRTDYFNYAYYHYGRDIHQQVLNLTQAEKERLVALLEENYRPENRVYRYNFFYDNCSTRPRDKVEEAVEGTVDYGTDMNAPTEHTFRELIYRYSEGHPWSRLAMDLCLGSEADKPISRRTMQFVPFLLQADLTKAQVVDSTGAGDVFHGAFLYGLLQGWDARRTARFSSAVSAIKCTAPGGRIGIPDVSITEEFMSSGRIDQRLIQKWSAYYKEHAVL